MSATHDNSGSELQESTGIQSTRTGGSGANLSATTGYWKQATPGAPVVPVSEFVLGDLPDGSANSLLGRAANSAGVLADIATSTKGAYPRLRGTALVFARDVINVMDYGAANDLVADDTTPVANAFADWVTAANAGLRPHFVIPAGGGCLSSLPITATFSSAVQSPKITMDSPLVYSGAAQTGAFLTIGIAGSNTVQTGRFRLWVERSAQSDWTDATHIGVLLKNFLYCHLDFHRIRYFTTGVRLEGAGPGGFAYNPIFLGRFTNNRYGLDLVASASAGAGFINANRLYNGSFVYQPTGGASDTMHRYGIRFLDENTTPTTSPNGNIGYGQVIEIGGSDVSYGHPIYFQRGDSNRFHDLHVEGGANIAEFAGNNTDPTRDPNANMIDVSVHGNVTTKVLDRSSLGSNVVTLSLRDEATRADKLVYAADDILTRATPYNGTNIHLYGIGVLLSAGTLTNRNASGGANLTFAADHLLVGTLQALGARVTTDSVTQLYCAVNLAGGQSTIVVQAYDSDGAVITSSGTWAATTVYALKARVQPTVKNGFWYRVTANGTTAGTEPTWPTTIGGTVVDSGVTWTCEGGAPVTSTIQAAMAYTSTYGGAWRVADKTEAWINVNPTVAAVFVGVTGGTTAAQIKTFRVYSTTPPQNGETPAVTLGFTGLQNWTRRLATQSPQTSALGTFAVGDLVWQVVPVVGQPIGWMCTVAGTPGTWVAMANL